MLLDSENTGNGLVRTMVYYDRREYVEFGTSVGAWYLEMDSQEMSSYMAKICLAIH